MKRQKMSEEDRMPPELSLMQFIDADDIEEFDHQFRLREEKEAREAPTDYVKTLRSRASMKSVYARQRDELLAAADHMESSIRQLGIALMGFRYAIRTGKFSDVDAERLAKLLNKINEIRGQS